MTCTQAHVCVLHTSLRHRHHGYLVRITVDATGSRTGFDKEVGLKRAVDEVIPAVTTGKVLFKWLRRAVTDEFFILLPRIRELVMPGTA